MTAGLEAIWATFGHAPTWVLRNPVYRSVQKRMRSHFLDLVARIRTSPERAAFPEIVRLNPPGTAVIRVADRDFEFAGYTIRKGDEVLVVIASDHRNPEGFERPNEFDRTR